MAATEKMEDEIAYRLDNGAPKVMPLIRKGDQSQIMSSSTGIVSYVRAKPPPDAIKNVWAGTTIDDVCNVSTINVYIDGTTPMQAYRAYRVAIILAGFDPIILGVLDCTEKSLKCPVPDFFNQCEDGTSAILQVYEVKAPLVYETAGKELEEFLESMKDQWRAQIMSLVRQGMKGKQVNANRKISQQHFRKAVQFLHDQCQTKQLDTQFEEAFKSLKL